MAMKRKMTNVHQYCGFRQNLLEVITHFSLVPEKKSCQPMASKVVNVKGPNGKCYKILILFAVDLVMIALLRSVIGPENSRRSLNQSDAELKPIRTWSPAFSRASSSLLGFSLSSQWFLRL